MIVERTLIVDCNRPGCRGDVTAMFDDGAWPGLAVHLIHRHGDDGRRLDVVDTEMMDGDGIGLRRHVGWVVTHVLSRQVVAVVYETKEQALTAASMFGELPCDWRLPAERLRDPGTMAAIGAIASSLGGIPFVGR